MHPSARTDDLASSASVPCRTMPVEIRSMSTRPVTGSVAAVSSATFIKLMVSNARRQNQARCDVSACCFPRNLACADKVDAVLTASPRPRPGAGLLARVCGGHGPTAPLAPRNVSASRSGWAGRRRQQAQIRSGPYRILATASESRTRLSSWRGVADTVWRLPLLLRSSGRRARARDQRSAHSASVGPVRAGWRSRRLRPSLLPLPSPPFRTDVAVDEVAAGVVVQLGEDFFAGVRNVRGQHLHVLWSGRDRSITRCTCRICVSYAARCRKPKRWDGAHAHAHQDGARILLVAFLVHAQQMPCKSPVIVRVSLVEDEVDQIEPVPVVLVVAVRRRPAVW